MVDTRSDTRTILTPLEFSSWRALLKITASVLLAAVAAFTPEYAGLTDGGRSAFFILLFAGGLWISEAIPAFAVSLLVIGLNIAILGRPDGVFAKDASDWERFIIVWGSPLIWLFFGGFVLAAAAEKTGLTHWLAGHVLRRAGQRASLQLLGCMLVTFVFSMFISNTATAAMMLGVLAPVLALLADHGGFRKALLLGVAFSANLGGMGSIIGSPPNAIAAGALRSVEPVSFAGWMFAGLPPAVILLALTWAYLRFRYGIPVSAVDVSRLAETSNNTHVALWRRLAVIVVFCGTVVMWLTSALHGLPATVISFAPICAFTTLGVLNATDIRAMPWDVLLLIAGGLSLGVAVTETGLATWLVDLVPISTLGSVGLALGLTYATALLSNLMSNTAAANILIPIAIAASAGFESQTVVPIALGASAAMCLPISTPPNAIAYGTGYLETRDLLEGGVLLGCIAPFMVTIWCGYVFG